MSATKRQHEDQLRQWAEETALLEAERLRLHGPPATEHCVQHWMDEDEIAARFSPSSEELEWPQASADKSPHYPCPVCGQPHP